VAELGGSGADDKAPQAARGGVPSGFRVLLKQSADGNRRGTTIPSGDALQIALCMPNLIWLAPGLSLQQTDVASKRVELLREAIPALRHLAIMANVDNVNALREVGEVQAAASAFGLAATTSEIRRAEDIVPAFEALKGRADAIYVVAEPLVFTNRARIHTLAMAGRLPAIYNSREYVEMGGLMSYGPNFPDLFRRSADVVDKILRGAKPADIPVQQPTQFDLIVNLTTAKALGLRMSESSCSAPTR
jgi:putative ABC transport system substrate-binding protein